jgi:DNA-binding CsgD family transcriptional regulator
MTAERSHRTYSDADIRHILALVAEGRTDAAIARQLGRTPSGVANLIKRLSETYGARNRPHLVARAYQCRILHVPPAFGKGA